MFSVIPSASPALQAFRYHLSEDAPIQISLHDKRGTLIQVLADLVATRGRHTFNWDGSQFKKGLYYLHFRSPRKCRVKRIWLR